MDLTGSVASVHTSAEHGFSKPPTSAIRMVEGHGVEGDAHAGTTVKHLSRVARDPNAPNLRQIHLIAAELFDDLAHAEHHVGPGDLGENVTTTGLDLFTLPTGTILRIGTEAQIAVTGLRNPCRQIDAFQPGLLNAVLTRDQSGKPALRAGVMAVVARSGVVRPGDAITAVLPDGPHVPLTRV